MTKHEFLSKLCTDGYVLTGQPVKEYTNQLGDRFYTVDVCMIDGDIAVHGYIRFAVIHETLPEEEAYLLQKNIVRLERVHKNVSIRV